MSTPDFRASCLFLSNSKTLTSWGQRITKIRRRNPLSSTIVCAKQMPLCVYRSLKIKPFISEHTYQHEVGLSLFSSLLHSFVSFLISPSLQISAVAPQRWNYPAFVWGTVSLWMQPGNACGPINMVWEGKRKLSCPIELIEHSWKLKCALPPTSSCGNDFQTSPTSRMEHSREDPYLTVRCWAVALQAQFNC